MTYAHAHVLERQLSRPRHDRPCPVCTATTLPQSPLEAIRRYEHIGRIPWGQRLDVQPCEMNR